MNEVNIQTAKAVDSTVLFDIPKYVANECQKHPSDSVEDTQSPDQKIMNTPTDNCINRLVRLLLRWICRKLVKQGPLHKSRIVAYYRIMREAAECEFTEDNKPTLDAFLEECHSEANCSCEAG